MSYLNRFIIEEESQFECQGVYGEIDPKSCKRRELSRMVQSCDRPAEFNSFGNHLILAGDFSHQSRLKILTPLYEPMYLLPKQGLSMSSLPMTITCIRSERLECVQKDRFEQFYNREGLIVYNRYDKNKIATFTLWAQKSIGDDIEDFFERIKSKIITPINDEFFSNLRMSFFLRMFDGINSLRMQESALPTFHLSMLSDRDENKLNRGSFRKNADFKKLTRLSNENHNYALSVCFRKTFIRRDCLYYEIYEPDNAKESIQEFVAEDTKLQDLRVFIRTKVKAKKDSSQIKEAEEIKKGDVA